MTFRFLGTLLALLVLYLLAERLPGIRLRKSNSWVNAGLAVFLFYALLAVYSNPLRLLFTSDEGYIRTYNIYHYYLGAKYFDELRYTHLYSCSLAADSVPPEVWAQDIPVRNLATYEILPREEIEGCPVEAFSEARWREFRQDLHYLTKKQDTVFWLDAVIDKGFNQTPFWTFVARACTNLIPLNGGLGGRILFHFDILLVAFSLALVAKATDARSALLLGIGIVTYFGTYHRLLGNFLQYTWLALLLGAISLWKLKRDALSAFCFSLAGMLHGFPFLLLSGFAARTAQRWLARRRHDGAELRREAAYLAFVAGTAVFLAALCTPFLGIKAWLQFFRNITLHSRELVAEPFNIGLKNLIATSGSENLFSHPYSYSENRAGTRAAMRYFEEHHGLYVLLAAAGVALFLFSVRRVKGADTFALSLLFLYIFFTLSPYYYLSLVLVFLLPARESFAAWTSQVGLLALWAYHMRSPFLPNYVSFRFGAHMQSEKLLALYLVAVTVLYAIESRRARLPNAAPGS